MCCRRVPKERTWMKPVAKVQTMEKMKQHICKMSSEGTNMDEACSKGANHGKDETTHLQNEFRRNEHGEACSKDANHGKDETTHLQNEFRRNGNV